MNWAYRARSWTMGREEEQLGTGGRTSRAEMALLRLSTPIWSNRGGCRTRCIASVRAIFVRTGWGDRRWTRGSLLRTFCGWLIDLFAGETLVATVGLLLFAHGEFVRVGAFRSNTRCAAVLREQSMASSCAAFQGKWQLALSSIDNQQRKRPPPEASRASIDDHPSVRTIICAKVRQCILWHRSIASYRRRTSEVMEFVPSTCAHVRAALVLGQ